MSEQYLLKLVEGSELSGALLTYKWFEKSVPNPFAIRRLLFRGEKCGADRWISPKAISGNGTRQSGRTTNITATYGRYEANENEFVFMR